LRHRAQKSHRKWRGRVSETQRIVGTRDGCQAGESSRLRIRFVMT
jgi:hypothetical protein